MFNYLLGDVHFLAMSWAPLKNSSLDMLTFISVRLAEMRVTRTAGSAVVLFYAYKVVRFIMTRKSICSSINTLTLLIVT